MTRLHFTGLQFLTLGVLTLALLPAECLRAQTGGRETLEGTVLSDKGAPVAGARILWQTADGRSPHALRSDAQGHFRIRRILPGIYQLRAVTRKASSEWSTNVVVRPGQHTQVTLRLEPALLPTAAPTKAPATVPARPKTTSVAK